MDVLRAELADLIAVALVNHPSFRPKRCDRAATPDRDQALARSCAGSVADHRARCGVILCKRAPDPCRSAGE